MPQHGFEQVFALGERRAAFAQYFSGRSFLVNLTDGSVPVTHVTFEPGCRNDGHIHHGERGAGDQILLCTAGSCCYQAWGQDPMSMVPGVAIRGPTGNPERPYTPRLAACGVSN